MFSTPPSLSTLTKSRIKVITKIQSLLLIQSVWAKKGNLYGIKGGLISERFSPWSFPQKNVPNH